MREQMREAFRARHARMEREEKEREKEAKTFPATIFVIKDSEDEYRVAQSRESFCSTSPIHIATYKLEKVVVGQLKPTFK